MKILIANQWRVVIGGAERYLQALLPLLRSRGHEVALLYENALDSPHRIDASVPDLPTWKASGTDGPAALAAVAAWRPDVVYGHGLSDPEVEERLARRSPFVQLAHNYHGTCATGHKCSGRPTPRVCERQLGAACLALNYARGCGMRDPRRLWASYQTQRRRNRLLTQYRAILVASNHMRDEYRRHGVPDDQLHLVPLFPTGVAPTAEPPLPRPWTSRVVLCGRLTALKGGQLLVPAVAEAQRRLGRPLRLTFLGHGPEGQRWLALADRLGVKAEVTGWVGATEVADVLAGADLLAVPSLWPEPFGLVGIEAGCLGVPAIGFRVGGIPDWLIPGESGELAPADPPTAAGLADALGRALGDPDHYQRLRIGAWRVAQRFSPERHLDQLDAVLRRVADG